MMNGTRSACAIGGRGADAARALGHRLLRGQRREEALAAWCDYLHQFPRCPAVLCPRRKSFGHRRTMDRSGDRPAAAPSGGGYKAVSIVFCSAGSLPRPSPACRLCSAAGPDRGKTLLLHRLAGAVDLEALANHRGSSFGQFLTVQPGQADFENRLAAALTIHRHRRYTTLVVEDEGRPTSPSASCPQELAGLFADAALVVLETPLAERIETILGEYVDEAQDCLSKSARR